MPLHAQVTSMIYSRTYFSSKKNIIPKYYIFDARREGIINLEL